MTLRTVIGNNLNFARDVARMIPHCDPAGFPTAVATIGIADGQRIVAGVVCYNHNRAAGTIDIAAAALPGHNWLTRPVIRLVFDTAFRKFDCQLVVMRTADQWLTDRLEDFGFDVIRIPRLYGRDTDGMFCTLTVEAWTKHPINRNPKAVRQQEAA